MPDNAKSLGAVVGGRMRAIRHERGQRQDDVAKRARECGLTWTQATVAAIETGRRELTAGELFLLPLVMGHAAELPDLFPPEAWVQLGPDAYARGDYVRSVLAGQSDDHWQPQDVDVPLLRDIVTTVRQELRKLPGFEAYERDSRRVWPEMTAGEWLAAETEAAQEVERRAAARLGVDVRHLAIAARRKWGRSLTAERDRRTPAGVTSSGHITRELLAELRPLLEAAGLIDKKEA